MDEESPLLRSDIRPPVGWQSFRNSCCRIPSERLITANIIALFCLITSVFILTQYYKAEEKSTNNVTISLYETYYDDTFEKTWKKGEALLEERKRLETRLNDAGVVNSRNTASWTLYHGYLKGDNFCPKISDCAIIVEYMRRELGECVDEDLLPDYCKHETNLTCSANDTYRTYDGSCNNLEHPTWGMSNTPFVRIIKPQYSDGVSSPRISVNGDSLPSARYLSNKLYQHRSVSDAKTTMLFMNLGLLIDHDMSKTKFQIDLNLTCCDPRVISNATLRHPECFAIEVPKSDKLYGPNNVTCLEFVRSSPITGECAGEREQINEATAFLDGSSTYGSSAEKVKELRAYKNGLLLSSTVANTSMLPTDKNGKCGTPVQPHFCFNSGDLRVNMQVEATAVHIVWFREHNRLATKLYEINPHWDDEKLFQEARKIAIAELQLATYVEFLPILLGQKAMQKDGLKIDPYTKYRGYDPTINPSVYNAFAAAAFRLGHSLIQRKLQLVGSDYELKEEIPLHYTFFNPSLIYHHGLDIIVRGMIVQPTHKVESYMTDEVRGHLFQPYHGKYGHDLTALGIQRGRDHGIAEYVKWREACGLAPVEKWDDLYSFMDKKRVDRLKQSYRSVQDIDLIPGALAEYHVVGSLVGPTHLCIISKQFKKTRLGDRFWFEIQNQPQSFTKNQLKEIYKSSLARIICDNSDNITKLQKQPLLIISDENPVVNCEEMPAMDLSYWKE